MTIEKAELRDIRLNEANRSSLDSSRQKSERHLCRESDYRQAVIVV